MTKNESITSGDGIIFTNTVPEVLKYLSMNKKLYNTRAIMLTQLASRTPNTTHNDTLFYLLTHTYTDFPIHCSLKQFSLPLDPKWAGTSPVWTLLNDSSLLSNSSTVRLSNLTLGDLYCVLPAVDNSTSLVQKVSVTFVS